MISAIAIERRIAAATPPNRLTTQRRLLQVAGAMRTGAAMMRFGSNLYLTELIMVTLLLLGLIVVRSVGPAGEGGRVVTVSEHNKVRTSTTPENSGRVTSDIGIEDLRGSLP